MRCGVDLVGLDQLRPDDGRLPALVWSWAPGEPGATGDCAVQRSDGRWQASDCAVPHRVACRATDGTWSVPAAAVAAAGAPGICAAAGGTFSTPRTGYENELVKTAAAGASVWLAEVRSGASWRALDAR
jgi:hypothetical protein